MGAYKPAEHEETTSVAPLLQFFELVHVGDTIQSMVQVYFDKELVGIRIIIPNNHSYCDEGTSYRSPRLPQRSRAGEKAVRKCSG